MAAGLETQLLDLVTIFIIAAGVGTFVAKVGRFPYTVALLLAGLGPSILGVHPTITISHDLILFVLLPPLLFEGAANTDFDRFRRNLPSSSRSPSSASSSPSSPSASPVSTRSASRCSSHCCSPR